MNPPLNPRLVKIEQSFRASILSKITSPLLSEHNIELWIKRDDLLHPVISGNKWRKLKYCLNHALALHAHTLISMGGAYSNHLHALGFTGQLLGLKTIGIIRGEPAELTPTLLDLQRFGMELRFVSRSEYRLLRRFKRWHELPGLKSGEYWLPEGGAQSLALLGVSEMVQEIDLDFDMIVAPCGTGTTLAGIINSVPEPVLVLGIAALKNAHFLNADVESLLISPRSNWEINLAYHLGGFGQINTELMAFIKDFEADVHIPLEPVYTGKMLYALYDLIKKGEINSGQRIIAVHTGGLQGNRGFNTPKNCSQ